MPCFHPINGWYSRYTTANGKRPITFKSEEAIQSRPLSVPCGQCLGCRLERSQAWAIRCVHEASQHEENCFLTLTYSPEHLKSDSLQKRDWQLFMKRLRKETGKKIRYFHCGEYGEKLSRPHYHVCLFGYDFPDKVLWSTREGNRLYTSEALNRIWGLGYCVIGEVTYESAAYVARYIMKKVTGEKAESHYQGRLPEYVTMSRRPGIGSSWYEKYKGDLFPHDKVVIQGKLRKVPKFYSLRYERENSEGYAKVKGQRLKTLLQIAGSQYNDTFRMKDKEGYATAKVSQLPRSLHDSSYL